MRYQLTKTGWLGAALFVLPTPISAIYIKSALTISPADAVYNRALERVRGAPILPEFPFYLPLTLATATLVGIVLLLVGRKLVQD